MTSTTDSRYTVEEFYGVEGDEWCVLDNEAEWVMGRCASREEAELELSQLQS
jgi:hypothetical protein